MTTLAITVEWLRFAAHLALLAVAAIAVFSFLRWLETPFPRLDDDEEEDNKP